MRESYDLSKPVLWLSVIALALTWSCNGDVAQPDPLPTPSPSPTPIADCQIIGGFHAARVVRNGKEVAIKPIAGWRYVERPTITAMPIFQGDITGADTSSCQTFTQVNAWEFRPLGECRAFADNVSGLSQSLACRRAITEGLFVRTTVPDPYNPQSAIIIESNWNVSE